MNHLGFMGRRATYLSWRSAKDRIFNPNAAGYARYGGAGLTFERDWLDFDTFLAEVGMRPIGTTLDRIEHDKGYVRGNVRWAKRHEQARNRKDNRWLEVEGERILLPDYCRKHKLPYPGKISRRWQAGIRDPKLLFEGYQHVNG